MKKKSDAKRGTPRGGKNFFFISFLNRVKGIFKIKFYEKNIKV